MFAFNQRLKQPARDGSVNSISSGNSASVSSSSKSITVTGYTDGNKECFTIEAFEDKTFV